MHFSSRLSQSTCLNRLCSLRGWPRFSLGPYEQRGRGRQRCCRAEAIGAGARAPGRWRVTGDLGIARFSHTATLLPNEQVLVAGGFSDDPFGYLASAELYDPAPGNWTGTGSLAIAR